MSSEAMPGYTYEQVQAIKATARREAAHEALERAAQYVEKIGEWYRIEHAPAIRALKEEYK